MPVVMALARVLHPLFHRGVKKGKLGIRTARIIPKVFGSLPPEQQEKIIRDSSLHMLKLAGELLKSRFASDRSISRKCYIAEGAEYFERVCRNGEGCTILTCHLGNWEWAAAYIAILLDHEIHAPVFVENSRGNQVLNWSREGHRIDMLPASRDPRISGRTLVRLIDYLKKGEVVYLVADQAALSEGYTGSFFGSRMSVFGGPFVLGPRTGKPFLPLYTIRDEDDRLGLHFEKPIYLTGENLEQDIRKVMDFFERNISAHPDQYLWSQDRW
jgi:KDO2-lipid IV(A) lauroyltransferase